MTNYKLITLTGIIISFFFLSRYNIFNYLSIIFSLDILLDNEYKIYYMLVISLLIATLDLDWVFANISYVFIFLVILQFIERDNIFQNLIYIFKILLKFILI